MQIALPTHDILQHCYLLRIQVLILIIFQTNIFQTVWLKKSQPESFLQLVSTIPGKVAAGHQLNLRKHQDQLHEQAARTLETEIAKNILEKTRAVGLPHSGLDPSSKMLLFIENDWIQGEAYYNAYEKDIAVVNIFFGGSTVFGEGMSYQI